MVVLLEFLVSRVLEVTLVFLEAKERQELEGFQVQKVCLESYFQLHCQMGHIHKVIQVFLVKEEALVTLESLVSLVFLGVKVLWGTLVHRVDWAGLEFLVFKDLLGILDLLVSLDPQEHKGFLVQLALAAFPAASAAATASATLWLSTARAPRFPCVLKAWPNCGRATVCCM